jgi:hypothetical protein
MATTQVSDLHFVVQRGDRSLDSDLLAVHGLTTHDIIVAAASVIAQGTTNANDPIWAAVDDMVRGTGLATAERFSVAASRIIGKAASGKVRDLTAAEAKAILALVAADISDFNTAVRTNSVAQLAAPLPRIGTTTATRSPGAAPPRWRPTSSSSPMWTRSPPRASRSRRRVRCRRRRTSPCRVNRRSTVC